MAPDSVLGEEIGDVDRLTDTVVDGNEFLVDLPRL